MEDDGTRRRSVMLWMGLNPLENPGGELILSKGFHDFDFEKRKSITETMLDDMRLMDYGHYSEEDEDEDDLLDIVPASYADGYSTNTAPKNLNAFFPPPPLPVKGNMALEVPQEERRAFSMDDEEETKELRQRSTKKTILAPKSKRARNINIVKCERIPKKSERVKGTVYIVGKERKKWDGRQWRRLCVVKDCCSAARGTTIFCIYHGKNDVAKTVVENVTTATDNTSQLQAMYENDLKNRVENPPLLKKRKSVELQDDMGELSLIPKISKTFQTPTMS